MIVRNDKVVIKGDKNGSSQKKLEVGWDWKATNMILGK